MVCGCEKCGTLMVQEQKGIQCRCVCPECGNHCDICIGFERPLTKAELSRMVHLLDPVENEEE